MIAEIEQALDYGFITLHSKIKAMYEGVDEDGNPIPVSPKQGSGRWGSKKVKEKLSSRGWTCFPSAHSRLCLRRDRLPSPLPRVLS